MIDLYYWTTPNGHKITIFLEETGLPYKDVPDQHRQGRPVQAGVSGGGAEQPDSRAWSITRSKGGGKPISIFESGAMLLYLAEKTGKFLPADLYGRYDAIQWTFWQMGGLGPMAGQNHHFSNYAQEKIKYAIDRYVNETNRLYGVLNKRLADRAFIAGDYSIADMASYPWVVGYKNQSQNIDDFPHLKRWLETIQARPATGARLRQGQGGQSEFRPAGDPYRRRAKAAVRTDRRGGEVSFHVSRTRRNAKRCAAEPGSMMMLAGPRISSAPSRDAALRPGNLCLIGGLSRHLPQAIPAQAVAATVGRHRQPGGFLRAPAGAGKAAGEFGPAAGTGEPPRDRAS